MAGVVVVAAAAVVAVAARHPCESLKLEKHVSRKMKISAMKCDERSISSSTA